MKRPHRFHIEVEPTFGSATTYSFQQGALCRQLGDRGLNKSTPTLTQWSAFWRLCRFLDLWQWKEDYTPEERMRDGQSWSLRIAFDKNESVTSSGHNGYPSLESADVPSATVDRFGLLLQFVEMTLMVDPQEMRYDFCKYDP